MVPSIKEQIISGIQKASLIVGSLFFISMIVIFIFLAICFFGHISWFGSNVGANIAV